MARIRTIKPEFFTSEDIFGMTPLARLFYVSLWCESDREGRLEWKPGTFKARYLPADECDINVLGDELVGRGLIVLYKVSGKVYAEIPTFTEHQVINNREGPSKIPPRDEHATLTRESGVKAEGKEGRKGREGKGREGNSNTVVVGLPEDAEESDDPAELPSPKAAPLPMREVAPMSEDPAIVLTVLLRRQGVTALFTHPAVQAWASRGVSAALLMQAVAVARESKGDAAIPVNYLVPIVDALLNPPSARTPSQSRTAPVNEKFNFSHLDRSGDQRAMDESMRRNGITMPADDEEIEI